MALTTSLLAPLDEGDFLLMALLWAYILPPLGFVLLCVPELFYWSLWLHKKLRQRSLCECAEPVAQVGASAQGSLEDVVDRGRDCVFTPISDDQV